MAGVEMREQSGGPFLLVVEASDSRVLLANASLTTTYESIAASPAVKATVSSDSILFVVSRPETPRAFVVGAPLG